MKVIITDEAIESLKTIVEFVSYTIGEKKASYIGKALLEEAFTLGVFSQRGPIEIELQDKSNEYRRIIFQNRYKIIYKIAPDAVYVLRFFDTRQDPAKIKG